MKPRVFISSTYYDLKYVRESLEKFMYNMNFEPVLFEANKVTFEHGKPLDISCFNEVQTCHIMILIIGGRYGSIISEQESEVEKNIYDKEYISITRKEYETALANNIPTFIFIDKNVHGEHGTYKLNRDFYDKAVQSGSFKFAHVDNITVFRFIDIVSTKAIKTFERIEEIEDYLKDQISGMFHLYLESLKLNSRQDEIIDAVKELKNLTTNINTIVNEVGKKIIEPERYEEVISEQFTVLLNFFFDKLASAISNDDLAFNDDEAVTDIYDIFLNVVFSDETLRIFDYSYHMKNPYIKYNTALEAHLNSINDTFEKIQSGFSVRRTITSVVEDYFKKLNPLIKTEEQRTIFKEKLRIEIENSAMPF